MKCKAAAGLIGRGDPRATRVSPYRIRVLRLGQFEITRISGGRFRLDGGAMFGIVPKSLWSRQFAADDRNRIQLDTNCVLVRANEWLVLIDTGFGNKLSNRAREQMGITDLGCLHNGLTEAGVTVDDITHVIPSHLHFDHAGGLTRQHNSGQYLPTFPSARVIVQRDEWEDALGDRPELAGSYLSGELAPLEQAGLVDQVEGDYEVVPGISVEHTGGHTRGHQVIRLQSEGRQAVYLGDLCPTRAHLKTMWTMAYDQYPLTVRGLKPALLRVAHQQRQTVLLDHEPQSAWGHIEEGSEGEFQFMPISENQS